MLTVTGRKRYIMKKTKNQLNQETANKLDEMNLSERARKVIAETDFNILYDVFGSLSQEDIELSTQYRIYGNDCLYDDIYDSYDEAREVADEYEAEDADGTRYHVCDGLEQWFD